MAAILESTTLSANSSFISVCFSLKAIKCLENTILYNILLEWYGLLLWCFLRSFLQLDQPSESCSIQPIHPTDFNQPETHFTRPCSQNILPFPSSVSLFGFDFCFRFVIFCCLGWQEVSRYQDKQTCREHEHSSAEVMKASVWR